MNFSDKTEKSEESKNSDKSEESKNSEEEEGSKGSDKEPGGDKEVVNADNYDLDLSLKQVVENSTAKRTRSGKISAVDSAPSKKDKEKTKSVAKPVKYGLSRKIEKNEIDEDEPYEEDEMSNVDDVIVFEPFNGLCVQEEAEEVPLEGDINEDDEKVNGEDDGGDNNEYVLGVRLL
ncbi:hypothetical protein QL285_075667 [Trifolium repens]|nr:hypothetical protein QL285_075667 [Trifolium repens]